MKQWMAQNKKLVWLAVALVVLLAAVGGIYLANRPATTVGQKHITVNVVDAQQQSTSFDIDTDAEMLRGALDGQNLIAGDESGSGLFVKTVNGITADDAKQEWWCFTKDGADVMTGVDSTPIADGDHFEITLKTGY